MSDRHQEASLNRCRTSTVSSVSNQGAVQYRTREKTSPLLRRLIWARLTPSIPESNDPATPSYCAAPRATRVIEPTARFRRPYRRGDPRTGWPSRPNVSRCEGLHVSKIDLACVISSAVPCAITMNPSAFTAASILDHAVPGYEQPSHRHCALKCRANDLCRDR